MMKNQIETIWMNKTSFDGFLFDFLLFRHKYVYGEWYLKNVKNTSLNWIKFLFCIIDLAPPRVSLRTISSPEKKPCPRAFIVRPFGFFSAGYKIGILCSRRGSAALYYRCLGVSFRCSLRFWILLIKKKIGDLFAYLFWCLTYDFVLFSQCAFQPNCSDIKGIVKTVFVALFDNFGILTCC